MRDWTEKYRPKTFDEMVGNDPIIESGRRFARNKNFPRLLLVGGSGTGKTPFAKVLAFECFGKDADMLEINCSSERGIDIIRNDIAEYAITKSSYGVPFKIPILDEVEQLTVQAQKALKKIMEDTVENCRFILITNEEYGLLPYLVPRCRRFYFRRIKPLEIVGVLKNISMKEGVKISQKALLKIALDSKGDLRYAIEELQSIAEGEERVTEEDVDYYLRNPSKDKILRVVKLGLDYNLVEALKEAEKLLDTFTARGFFTVVTDRFVNSWRLKDSCKKRIAKALARVNLYSGNDKLQVYSFLAELSEK